MSSVLDHGGENDGGELLEMPNNGQPDIGDNDDDDGDSGHLGIITSRRTKRKSRRQRINPQSPGLDASDEDVNERVINAEARLQQRVDDDLDDVFSGLNFGTDNHQVTVTRMEPKFDDNGDIIAGHLNTFTSAITIEDIKAKYGGGIYKVTVRGPKPNGRGSVIKGSKTIPIAGPPKLVKKPSDGSVSSDVKLLLENKDRDLQRMADEAKTNQNAVVALLSKEDKTMPLVLKMLDSQGSQMNPVMTMMMQMQQKEAEMRRLERQEDKEREQRRESERLRAEEKAERLRIEEKRLEEQRRKDEKEFAMRQHELQMKQMEQQQNMMMNMMLSGSKSEKEQQMTMLKIMNDNSAAAVSQAQGMMQFQGNIFQSMLQESKESAKQKSQFSETLEHMAAMKDMMRFMNGGEEDNRATWEKVIDKAGEVLPSLVSGASSVFKQNLTQPTNGNGSGNGGQQQLMPPGTVIVAEDDEPTPQVKVVNNVVKPQQQQNQQPINANQPTTPGEVGGEAELVNDLTEPFFPPFGDVPQVQVAALVKNIDFAIRNDWSTEKVFNDIVKKFPDGVVSLLVMQSEDKLVDFIAENTPETWPISMPKGEDMIRQLYKMVKKSKS